MRARPLVTRACRPRSGPALTFSSSSKTSSRSLVPRIVVGNSSGGAGGGGGSGLILPQGSTIDFVVNELEAFRAEVRAWLEANAPRELYGRASDPDAVVWGGRRARRGRASGAW